MEVNDTEAQFVQCLNPMCRFTFCKRCLHVRDLPTLLLFPYFQARRETHLITYDSARTGSQKEDHLRGGRKKEADQARTQGEDQLGENNEEARTPNHL